MQFVFQALFEFFGMMFTGRGSPTDFPEKPMWFRLLMIPVALVIALLLAFLVLAIGAFLFGVVRGLSS